MRRVGIGLLVVMALASWTLGTAMAAEATLEQKVAQLEEALKQAQNRIGELEQETQGEWLNTQKQEQIRQLVEEVLADAKAKGELGAPMTAGYDQGFYIKAADEAFLLKVNALFQFRYTGLNVDGPKAVHPVRNKSIDNDRNDFEVERGEISLGGHLWDNNLTYNVTFTLESDTNGSGTLKDWYVNYKFDPMLQVRAGQFKLPQGQQELTSSGEQQFVDCSLANEAFKLDRGTGVMAHGNLFDNVRKDLLNYQVGVFNGFDTDNVAGIDWANNKNLDTNFAVAARIQSVLLGDDNAAKDLEDEPDLKKLDNPALRIGAHFGYNDMNAPEGSRLNFLGLSNGASNPGVTVVDNTSVEMTQFGWDARFKWQGLALSAEHFIRTYDYDGGNIAGADAFPNITGDTESLHVQGGYLQAGYFISKDLPLEPIVRIGGIWDNDGDNCWEQAVGANYYIKGHDLKIQVDWTDRKSVV